MNVVCTSCGINVGVALRSNLDIAVYDFSRGAPVLVDSQHVHNIVTLLGRNLIRDLLHWVSTADGSNTTGIQYFSVGTSSSAFAASSTALNNEVYRDVWTQRTKSDGQTVYKYFLGTGASSSPFNAVTLTEAGQFGRDATATTGTGDLYSAATFTGIAKTTSIAISFTWTDTWADDNT